MSKPKLEKSQKNRRSSGLKSRIILFFAVMTLITFLLSYFIAYRSPFPFLENQPLLKWVICLIIFILEILIVWRVMTPLLNTIGSLIDYTERLARGDTDFKVDINQKYELGQLARAIRGTQLGIKKISLFLSLASGDILRGNLSIRTDVSYLSGEYAKIMDNNNKIDDSICDLIRNIREAAENVNSASQQISDGAQALAQGSTEQAAAIREISSTVSELVEKTKKNSENATAAKELSEEVNAEAEGGSAKMKELLAALEEINTASSNISNIIKVIDDIAFQTNILALNASVEAARAGIHGKGFAVVAEEVKNLANKSSQAAKGTNALILENISKVNHGVAIGEDMEKTLSKIVHSISRATDSISEIAESSLQQVEAIEQLNSGIEQISVVIQNNTATAEESASSSEEMSAQAAALRDMVAHYRIDVEEVVTEPGNWSDDPYHVD